jgi:Mce-associated membrane protein
VTAAVAEAQTSSDREISPDAEPVTATAPAPWWARAVALVVDVAPGAAVVTTAALVAVTLPLRGAWWWACVVTGAAAMVATTSNRILVPAATGWSLGRAALRVSVVSSRDASAAPLGARRLLVRELAHLLDTASVFVGWLWPLWDGRGRTFADLVAGTEARRAAPQKVPRSAALRAAVVFLTAALLCVAGAAVSYQLAYQYEQASDRTRAEVALQGPKIVEEMLSYYPQTLRDDFARAQSLTTDDYREKLIAEQESVQNRDPVANEYRASNSAVLSASPHRATMLLFLQGDRGDEAKRRLLSATVRVTFATSAGQWRVDDLAVVTTPGPAEDHQ